MKVYIVNMGIGDRDRTENSKAMRVFHTRDSAFDWVKRCFQEQIQELEQSRNGMCGLSIGNSFHIYEMDVEKSIPSKPKGVKT